MRIIDKNTDFYDYMQNIYIDKTLTFDRTDSFILTKDEVCKRLYCCYRLGGRLYFSLLQICNTFWLFLIEATKINAEDRDRPTDYNVELLSTWKNYSKQRELCKLNLISFNWDLTSGFRVSVFPKFKNGKYAYSYDKSSIKERASILVNAIDTDNYNIERSLSTHTIYLDGWRQGHDDQKFEKHIPLLKASGFAGCIDPQDIYLSFEEHFSLEKTESERTESLGLTDKEKIENHGFDTKVSFRGN